MKTTKLRREARGRQCQVRVPFVCSYDDSTTVLAHLGGFGLGIRHLDIHGAWCCFDCHEAVDGRRRTDYSTQELRCMLLEGIIRTQMILAQEGKISWIGNDTGGEKG